MAASLQAQSQVPTLGEILSHNDIDETHLDKECSQQIRYDIAIKIIDWKMIGYYFGIPEEKLVAIQRDNQTEEERRVALLNTWHKREGQRATYRQLMNAFLHRERCDLANKLSVMIKSLNSVDRLPEGSGPPGECIRDNYFLHALINFIIVITVICRIQNARK